MNIVLKAVVLAGAILFGGYAQKKWGIFDKAEGAAKSGCEKGKQCFDKFKKKAEDAAEEAKEKVEDVVEEVQKKAEEAAEKIHGDE